MGELSIHDYFSRHFGIYVCTPTNLLGHICLT